MKKLFLVCAALTSTMVCYSADRKALASPDSPQYRIVLTFIPTMNTSEKEAAIEERFSDSTSQLLSVFQDKFL
jgi:hypothetical protein